MSILETINVPTNGAIAVGGGAAAGVGLKATIGGMGLAAAAPAVAVPMVLAGATLGLLLYGAYRLGRSRR